ncbi:hypothetical protein Esi_0138_0025 [Ectocarpus siliculosus]|uniref:Uncharacterized protein n=1 Tax=Ectocarpus siliculosus TaxID=2880 RepID=D7FJV5_ECTSI|nr:hypothetical protein Esi_0138_0025 [Ectocarpus siliculosus]|eukprot:CBJ29203.1 hypothetical protein Esi_0138_0025 [Ectocarpus siliculosus]
MDENVRSGRVRWRRMQKEERLEDGRRLLLLSHYRPLLGHRVCPVQNGRRRWSHADAFADAVTDAFANAFTNAIADAFANAIADTFAYAFAYAFTNTISNAFADTSADTFTDSITDAFTNAFANTFAYTVAHAPYPRRTTRSLLRKRIKTLSRGSGQPNSRRGAGMMNTVVSREDEPAWEFASQISPPTDDFITKRCVIIGTLNVHGTSTN